MFAVRSQQPWGVPTSPYGFDEPRELPQRLSYAGLEAAALLCSLHNADMSYQPEMQPRADTDGGNLVEPEASRTKASETLKQQEKGPRTCADCGVTETCFWRRDKATGESLCNACGLFLTKHNSHRPASLSRK
jgi:hypothetical protein